MPKTQVKIVGRCAKKKQTSDTDFYEWLELSTRMEQVQLHKVWSNPILLYRECTKETPVYGIKKWNAVRNIFDEIVKYEMSRRGKKKKQVKKKNGKN